MIKQTNLFKFVAYDLGIFLLIILIFAMKDHFRYNIIFCVSLYKGTQYKSVFKISVQICDTFLL